MERSACPHARRVSRGPATVLITEVPGVHAESITYEGQSEERLWAEAGNWLRNFHARTNEWLGDLKPDGSPWSEPGRDPVEHVRKSMETRLRQGKERGVLDAAELDFACGRFDEGLPSLFGSSARSIHRDFTPRNWLAYADGRLAAVIDFEHARWDLRAADLNRPWDYDFLRNPRLIDAFYDAYGQPDERFVAQILTLRIVNLVSSIVWGLEVGEEAFSLRNRKALHRLMQS